MTTSDITLPEKLDRLIDENLDNPSFSIDAICLSLGVSRSQLHRTIKERTQVSASLYIRKRRLLTARHLLTSTNLRISEISDQVGFSNAQNFSTYFTEEFQVSPTEFRRLQTSLPQASVQRPAVPGGGIVLTPDAPPLPDLPTPARWRRRGWLYAAVVAGVLLSLGVGLYAWNLPGSAGRPAQPVSNSLAVLPFVNLSDADSSPACEGIMDEVHTSVSLLKNLKVIARSSSDQYQNTRKSIWQIGDELQVANLLKGSVLKTADQLQIKVELINTQDDIRVWSKTYSGPYSTIFQLTDQLVRDVAGQLKMSISTSASEKLAQARTRNLKAYNSLVQGRQLLVSRMNADLLASLSRFDRALAFDSTFAEAYALKAVAYHLLIGSEKIDNQTLDRLTEENAMKAIRLDPTNSTAYGVLGSLYYATYQWQASENAFRIALQYNPNDAQIYHWYSLLMRTTGQFDKAIQYSARAIALDPLHPVMMGAYISNCALGNQVEQAREGIESGQALFDKSFAFQMGIAYYWMVKADYHRAAVAFREAQRLNPDDKGQTPMLIYCEAKRGNRTAAHQFLQTLTATTPRSNYERAVVYAGLNQADSSLHYLQKAADGGYLYRDTKIMPVFRPYHAHPIFRSVMRAFKLPEQ